MTDIQTAILPKLEVLIIVTHDIFV